VDFEALRYLSLTHTIVEKNYKVTPLTDTLRILVLGDYLPGNTQKQMLLLAKSSQSLPKGTVIIVKPHPACPVQVADYPTLQMRITIEPISKLLVDCNVVYTSNTTSSAVDVYCAGLPVVSVLDPNTLNLSPLRGRHGVLFVSTPKELADALITFVSKPYSARERRDFFNLDIRLTNWRKLLFESY
jgi:surface carbohydrate biosynthesis protein (TIGR04326 family)